MFPFGHSSQIFVTQGLRHRRHVVVIVISIIWKLFCYIDPKYRNHSLSTPVTFCDCKKKRKKNVTLLLTCIIGLFKNRCHVAVVWGEAVFPLPRRIYSYSALVRFYTTEEGCGCTGRIRYLFVSVVSLK